MGIENDSKRQIEQLKLMIKEIRKYDETYLNQLKMKDKRHYIKVFVEEKDQNQELFSKIRKEGIKESQIVEMILEDKIEEFISLVDHFPINLNEEIEIEKTTFGTYTGELTPIDYSALFGSVAIYKYLYLKDVNININIIIKEHDSNIKEFAIQGRNYEIIHLLEERKEIIEELNKNQQKYLELSMKMLYNEIFEYIMSNYKGQITEGIVKSMMIYRNYDLLNHIIGLNQIELKDKAIITIIFQSI